MAEHEIETAGSLSPEKGVAGRRSSALTPRGIRALKPGAIAVDIRDGAQRGLILTVLPSGRKQFCVRYRIPGTKEGQRWTQRRLVLGEWPDLSLAQARKRARNTNTAVTNGADPAGDQHAAREKPTDTVAALVADYKTKHVQVHQRGREEEERILDVEILPKWKDRSVRGLTRRDVRALLEPIVTRGSSTMANRVLAVVRRLLNYGIRNDWLDANPAALMEKPGAERSRDRVLSDEEIRALWGVLSRWPATAEKQAPGRTRALVNANGEPFCPIAPALAAVQKIRLLTAARNGEVVKMRWRNLDLAAKWWTIPGTDTKNGEAHRVPLVDEAIAIIKAQRKQDEDEPEYVFVGCGESVRDRAKKAGAALSRVLGFEFRGHDLRRTAATRMAEAGIPREHIAHVLNHVQGSRVTRIYDKFHYDGPKRIALDTWARTLTTLLQKKDAGAVVPFARQQA